MNNCGDNAEAAIRADRSIMHTGLSTVIRRVVHERLIWDVMPFAAWRMNW